MALEDYARKREFDLTPEPAPALPTQSPGNLFCIQRHDARRLHYDLRIEVNGTLKSWAVPQGPSLDPSVKRLAVMVEDHPLLYATFEGNIPKGNYGAGSMMLWDVGTFDVLEGLPAADQIARGDFKIRFHGQKIKGDFALVRLKNSAKQNEWLLIKKKDAAVQANYDINQFEYSVSSGRTQHEIAHDFPPRANYLASLLPQSIDPMPTSITPMLASLSDTAPAGPGWVYEVKWDGVRALAYLANSAVRVVGRKGTPMDRPYPELARLPEFINASTAILDGEIATLDEKGRPSFERLQPRIMATDTGAIAQLARSRPVLFFAFDLLYLNGRDLRAQPLEERKRLLQSVIEPGGPVRFSEHFPGPVAELLTAVRSQGLEGLVAKRLDGRYLETRSRDWVKIKVNHEQEFILCGYLPGERAHFGSLILGVYDGDQLHWAGNVGTGFDQKMMAAIRAQLDPLVTGAKPFPGRTPKELAAAVWTQPQLVCTCKYLEWTSEGRLRAPVFLGLRPDIDPAECTRTPAQPEPRVILLPGDKDEMPVEVDGIRMRFKNLNKLFYPADQITKRDLINYYAAVADLLLPHLQDRPLSLRRYPDGITKEGFFQKNTADGAGFPDWLRTESILAEHGKMRTQVIGGRRADLIYLANLGCIDQNPWMSRVATLDHPDYILIDLDPQECPYPKLVEAALLIRRKLDLLALEGYPKTTGGDGLHIFVPLEPIYSYDQARHIAEILARLCAAERPDLFTFPRAVQKRDSGKVYFDWMQIARGKTISAPYVPRAHPGATVATPLEWRELTPQLDPKHFHLRNALDRFDRVGDLFSGVLKKPQSLDTAIERLAALLPS